MMKALCGVLLGAAIVSYVYAGYVKVWAGLSVGALSLIALCALLVARDLLGGAQRFPRPLFQVAIVGLLFVLLTAAVNSTLDPGASLDYLFPFAVYYAFFKVIASQRRGMGHVTLLAALIVLSSVVAVLQAWDVEAAWQLRYMMPAAEDVAVEAQLQERSKPAGMAYFAVQLSYQIFIAAILLLAMHTQAAARMQRGWYLVLAVLLIPASALVKSASAFAGIGIAFVVYLYGTGRIVPNWKTITATIVVVVLVALSPLASRILEPDASMMSRYSFGVVGILLMLEHPFGVPMAELTSAKLEVLASLGLDLPMLDAILKTSFHNSFLNVGVQLGWGGFLLYVYAYAAVGVTYRRYLKHPDPSVARLALVGYAGVIGYLMQCLTHNAGPFTSDPYFWILNGVLLGLMYRALGSENSPARVTT